jgi:hypothetical protein
VCVRVSGVVGIYPVVLTECDGILDEVGSGTGGVQIFDTGKSGVLVHRVDWRRGWALFS